MSKWYKIGFQDALDGLQDPPWYPARDYVSYMAGHADGERQRDMDQREKEDDKD